MWCSCLLCRLPSGRAGEQLTSGPVCIAGTQVRARALQEYTEALERSGAMGSIPADLPAEQRAMPSVLLQSRWVIVVPSFCCFCLRS